MTPREPDRYEAKGVETWRALRIMTEADAAPIIAAALRQAADEALKRAAYIADSYGCDYAAKNIRALASPAAAPAAEPCCAGASSGGLSHSLDCPRFPLAAPDKHEDWCALFGNPEAGKSCDCQPGAPSLLPRVLAALEDYGTPRGALLAAELRRYIAGVEAGHAEAPDAERDRNRHNAMLVEAWREEFNTLCKVLFHGNDGPIGWKHVQAKVKALADGGEG